MWVPAGEKCEQKGAERKRRWEQQRRKRFNYTSWMTTKWTWWGKWTSEGTLDSRCDVFQTLSEARPNEDEVGAGSPDQEGEERKAWTTERQAAESSFQWCDEAILKSSVLICVLFLSSFQSLHTHTDLLFPIDYFFWFFFCPSHHCCFCSCIHLSEHCKPPWAKTQRGNEAARRNSTSSLRGQVWPEPVKRRRKKSNGKKSTKKTKNKQWLRWLEFTVFTFRCRVCSFVLYQRSRGVLVT